MLGVSIIFVIP